MTRERWEEVRQFVAKSFKVLDEYTEDLEPGRSESVEFETPQGILKVMFSERPRVIGKKTHYSHRPGADVRVDYEYSPDELVGTFEAFRWKEASDEWEVISSDFLAS